MGSVGGPIQDEVLTNLALVHQRRREMCLAHATSLSSSTEVRKPLVEAISVTARRNFPPEVLILHAFGHRSLLSANHPECNSKRPHSALFVHHSVLKRERSNLYRVERKELSTEESFTSRIRMYLLGIRTVAQDPEVHSLPDQGQFQNTNF